MKSFKFFSIVIFISLLQQNTALQEENFTFLGSHVDKVSNRAISYYMGKYELTHDAALLECNVVFFGRLATIMTAEQNDMIRIKLQFENMHAEYVHTGGRYNKDSLNSEKWEWDTLGRAVGPFLNWRGGQPSSDLGQCITLIGTGSSYGWEAKSCSEERKFICEVGI